VLVFVTRHCGVRIADLGTVRLASDVVSDREPVIFDLHGGWVPRADQSRRCSGFAACRARL